MGYETRIAIVKILKNTPGLNGGDIAQALNRTTIDNQSDMLFLKRTGVIRREGDNRHSQWYAVDGAVVMQPTMGPRSAAMRGNKHHLGKNMCDYHRAGNPRNGICGRCQIGVNVGQKKRDAQLKKLFPVIFKD